MRKMDESENLQRFKRFGARRSSCWGFWPAANTSGLDNYPTFFFVSFVFSFVQRRLFFFVLQTFEPPFCHSDKKLFFLKNRIKSG